MKTAKDIADEYFLEMRYRCLSLAADLDRIQRAPNGLQTLQSDSRLLKLKQALHLLVNADANRAEQVLKLFSDLSAPPAR